MICTEGRVVYLELEGGFWGIVGDDGRSYCPQELPEPFRQSGMRVRAELEPLDSVSFRMWGTPVRVVHLETVE